MKPPHLLLLNLTAWSQFLWFGTAASQTNMLSRVEASLDATSLGLLTRSADNQTQTVLDNMEASLVGSPRSLCREVRRLVIPFVWPDSTHYHDEDFVKHIDEMLDTLVARQHDDGTFSVGNRHSPPDTGFLIEDFGMMVRLLEADDHDKSDGWAKEIRGILVKAGKGLSKGGIHTPNHRWKVCAALARISRITENDKLIDRVDEWLAEGIDIDDDGIYSERSPIYFSEVSNPSLLTVARELDRPALIDDVRRNLETAIQLSSPEGEIETIQSRRQDQNQSPHYVSSFYPEFRELAIRDGNGRFAAMTRLIEEKFGPQLGDYLADLMERPDLAAELPKSEDPFGDFAKSYPTARLFRERRGNLSVSAFGGTDFYDIDGQRTDLFNFIGSGLSTNPTFFRALNGKVVLEAVRLVPNFFSMGHFRSAGLKHDEKSGKVQLGAELEVPYYLPMPPERRDPNGDYKLSRSVDGRFYSKLDFSNRPTSMRRLETKVDIEPTKEGYDLKFQIDGEDEVEMTLELTFRSGGKLKGVEEAEDEEGTKVSHLKNGTGTYTLGNDSISFGPGNGDGMIMAAAGEQYSWLKGSLKLEGETVYITGKTPMNYTLKLGFP